MIEEEILSLIELISPHGKDYVREGFKNNTVEIIYSIFTDKNKGTFIKVDNKDCCIFYAVFLKEYKIEDALKIITSKTKEYIEKETSKEICFNVYGNNEKVIKCIRNLGFKSDMEGYHLEYRCIGLPLLGDYNFIVRGFESNMLKEFTELFDSAYYKLNLDNGWNLNIYSSNEAIFNKKLTNLNNLNSVCSFWLKDELVGSYLLHQNYITDIVIKPKFQNKGYGHYILAHCIRNMMINKSINNIRLRVAKSNTVAKKLYEKNGFVTIASFAEHTYEKNKQD